jgi:putative FmdB family regulatory protein
MPIYEYRCEACAERFEELVRGPGASVACPGCGGTQVERLISTFAGVGGRQDTALPQHPRFSQPAGGCGCGHGH